MLEKDFERNIGNIATLMGCIYYKIPDTKMLNANNRFNHREEKRPFDGVLITPNRTFVIEAKIASGQLKPHQLYNMIMTNSISENTAYVVRKYPKYIRIDYHIKGQVIKTKVENEKQLINFFKR